MSICIEIDIIMLIAIVRIPTKGSFVNEDWPPYTLFGIRYKAQRLSLLSLTMEKTDEKLIGKAVSEKYGNRLVFFDFAALSEYFWRSQGFASKQIPYPHLPAEVCGHIPGSA